jgi:predicted dehydrogenase
MIKTSIIGLGRMGFTHFSIANAQPDVIVLAISEPSSFLRGFVKKHSRISCYKNYKQMIDTENLDCVFIATPSKWHFEVVQYAIQAGLHVFVEKPLCLNPIEGRKLIQLVEHDNVVNQVGYHNRFIGTFREAKRLLDLEKIGKIYHVVGEAYGPVVLKDKGQTWRSVSSEGGGCLYDYATHVVNLIQYLVGSPVAISGAVLRSIYSRYVDDAVYATIHYRDGISGQLSVNWSDESYRKMFTQITILAKKGKMIVDGQELKVFFRENPIDESYEKGWNIRWVTDLSPEVLFYVRGEEYSAQTEYFFDRIRKRSRVNINSFSSAWATDWVIDLIKTDAQSRKDVEWIG